VNIKKIYEYSYKYKDECEANIYLPLNYGKLLPVFFPPLTSLGVTDASINIIFEIK